MATVGLTITDTCGGSGHVRIAMTVNGVSKGNFHFEADELLSDISDSEMEAAIKTILRIYKIGKSRGVMRTSLQAGISVVI